MNKRIRPTKIAQNQINLYKILSKANQIQQIQWVKLIKALFTSFKYQILKLHGFRIVTILLSSPIITGYLLKGHIKKKNYRIFFNDTIIERTEFNQKVIGYHNQEQ